MEITNKNTRRLACLIAAMGILSYISLLFGDNLWMDEAFSAMIVKGSFSEMITRSNQDTLPPLYNVLNWCMTKVFGFNSPALRITSVLPMAGCLILSATVIRKKLGDMVSIIFSLCLSGAPWMFYYGTEIRMYSLSLFFVTLCMCAALDAPVFSKSERIMFITGVLLSGWTHHFAFVAALFICLYVLIMAIIHRKEDPSYIRNTLLSFGVIILLYIPCFINTLRQIKRVRGYFSMPDTDIQTLLSCLKQPFITKNTLLSVLLILMFVCAAATGIFLSAKKKDLLCQKGLILLCLYPFVTAFGYLAVLILKSNIFSQRYLIPTLGVFWLGFAMLASGSLRNINDLIRYKAKGKNKDKTGGKTDGKTVKTDSGSTQVTGIDKGPGALTAVCCLVILLAISIHSYVLTFADEYSSKVKEMRDFFAQNVKEGDRYLIVEDNYEREICFRYYFPGFKKADWDEITGNETGTLWYVEVPGYADKTELITDHGYDYELAGDFGFDRYEFKLYKLKKWAF